MLLASNAAALAPQDGGAAAPVPAPAVDRAAVVEAFAILRLAGEGNTVRTGPKRLLLRRLFTSLLRRQTESGAFVPETSPTFAFDQAVITLAMNEVLVSGQAQMPPAIALGTRALAEALAAGPITTEVAVFVELQLRCRRAAPADAPDRAKANAAPPLDPDADLLAASLAACRVQPPSTPAEIAAEHLLRRLRRQSLPAGLSARRPWPTPAAAEPLATFYLELADYRPEDPAWRTASAQRAAVLTGLGVRADGVLSWDPVGPLGDALGRDGVTSLHELSLQLCHRSCRLLCVREQ